MTHLSSTHHSFDIELAAEYGINEAIIIHHFQHWIKINRRLNRNLIEGRTWTYQTLDEIAAHFPYLSKSQVYDVIEHVCTGRRRRSEKDQLDFDPVIMKGNFNKTKFDKTIWYAFINEEKFTKLAIAKMDEDNRQYPDLSAPIPIPDPKPDALTNTQTTAGIVAASFHSEIEELLKNVEIPQADKKFILESDYPIEVKRNAILWAIHPKTKINKTTQQAIKWALTNKPELPKEEVDATEENKKLAHEIHSKASIPQGSFFEILSKHVEIGYSHIGNVTCIDYSDNAFKEQILNALRKVNIKV